MPAPDADLQTVQLAALLHDVGKLFQRADPRPPAGYAAFGAADHGAHGAHAKWSAAFAERHVAGRWSLKPHDLLTHHLLVPPTRTAQLVALADRWAAGEREGSEIPGAPPPWESQLLPVFARLGLPAGEPHRPGSYPLAPLALEREALFPTAQPLPAEAARRGYRLLWEGFERDFAQLGQTDFDAYLEAVYHLLRRYCWCVPSAAYQQTPDVSLFDHARLTCAIAACLHLEGLGDADLEALLLRPRDEATRDRPLMLLVGGDVSGLQNFLYTLAAKGAARTLRGRSFYLQLLAESAARFLLGRLGLSGPNALYWGGGHFYLLAPASAETELERAAAEVERTMLDLHRGDLGLAVARVPLSAADFEREQFGRKWGEVGAALAEAKGRRFHRVARAGYEALFAPFGGGGSGDRCAACHAELPGSRGAEESRCPDCRGMEALGMEVARAAREPGALLTLGFRRPEGPRSGWQEALGRFGTWWEFGPGPGNGLRYLLNGTDFVAAGAEGFRWIPSVIPWEGPAGQGMKDFDDLAADSVGIERLGVLRMDVDDLGRLFAGGLPGAATASRVASLSSSLALFFEGWVNRLCRQVEADPGMLPARAGRRAGLLYGVYSGGDDLFVVGAWDLMPLLARRIRSDLAAFALGNPAVTISAGIALVDSHLPLYQAAAEALEALEDSKVHQRTGGPDKDAVTLLGETLGWEEVGPVWSQAADLARLVSRGPEGGGAPRSLLSLLEALHEMYRREVRRQTGGEAPDRERLYYGRWTWMAAYGLGRAQERARTAEARSALAALQKQLADPRTIRWVGLAARWAEYLTRSREVERR